MQSVVYLAETRNGGLMKIGTTTNLNHRYDSLNRHSRQMFGQEIRFVAVMAGGIELERELIQKYRLATVAGREWFMPVPDMLREFIGREIDMSSLRDSFCRHGVRLCCCNRENGVKWDWKSAEIAKKAAAARWKKEGAK